jgi:hypothetical protein
MDQIERNKVRSARRNRILSNKKAAQKLLFLNIKCEYAYETLVSSFRQISAKPDPGFFGLSPPRGLFRGGGFSRGSTLGASPFGGGFFWSLPRCADTDTARPISKTKLENMCKNLFIKIAAPFSLL